MTDKQKRFVDEYVIDCNAAAAARRAGYSEKTARSIGEENLSKPDIAAAIADKQADIAERNGITQDMVLREYAKIAFSDMRKFSEWGPGGVKLIKSDALDDDSAACVAEVSQTITEAGGSIKFKLHDKKAALDSICKMCGFNAPEAHDVTSKGEKIEAPATVFYLPRRTESEDTEGA